MQKSRILLVGNCVLDQIWQLAHFPEQDEEMRATALRRVIGGNASNSAQMLRLLGNDVELLASFAQDSAADWLIQQLNQLGITTTLCRQRASFKTPESSIWLNTVNGSRTIVHYRDLPELELQQLQQIQLESYRWLHFEGRNIATLERFLAGLNSGVNISLEIEKERAGIERLLPFVQLAIVSNAYLQSKKISVAECLQQFQQINPALNIVCTLGADGVIALDRSGRSIQLAAAPVTRVVDTVAAGDCFIGALIHKMLQQDDFYTAVDYANKIAAQKIQYRGITLGD